MAQPRCTTAQPPRAWMRATEHGARTHAGIRALNYLADSRKELRLRNVPADCWALVATARMRDLALVRTRARRRRFRHARRAPPPSVGFCISQRARMLGGQLQWPRWTIRCCEITRLRCERQPACVQPCPTVGDFLQVCKRVLVRDARYDLPATSRLKGDGTPRGAAARGASHCPGTVCNRRSGQEHLYDGCARGGHGARVRPATRGLRRCTAQACRAGCVWRRGQARCRRFPNSAARAQRRCGRALPSFSARRSRADA